MALTEVECEGYKAFSSPTKISLRPLTIIFGRNNSGKTTLARLPMFAAASLASLEHLYVLSVGDVRFGSTFADLASKEQAHPSVSFRLVWTRQPDSEQQMRALSMELQYVTKGVERHSVQPRKLAIDSNPPIEFQLTRAVDTPYRQLIRDHLGEEDRRAVIRRTNELRSLQQSIIHIPSGRAKVAGTYISREPNAWTVGEVPYLLASNTALMGQVNTWFNENLDGINLAVDVAAFAFRIVEAREQVAISLSDSGRGTQSVLPVVALLLGASRDGQPKRIIVVEEPEEHLHPSAHGAVGDLLIEASRRSQVLVETHSEGLVLRLRRRIADGHIAPEDVAFYFVDENHHVEHVTVDRSGIAENWPVGVFEGDVEEAQAIVQAKLAAMESLPEQR
jgi:predicted TIM-barrel fold metal-dependent hydrolase